MVIIIIVWHFTWISSVKLKKSITRKNAERPWYFTAAATNEFTFIRKVQREYFRQVKVLRNVNTTNKHSHTSELMHIFQRSLSFAFNLIRTKSARKIWGTSSAVSYLPCNDIWRTMPSLCWVGARADTIIPLSIKLCVRGEGQRRKRRRRCLPRCPCCCDEQRRNFCLA